MKNTLIKHQDYSEIEIQRQGKTLYCLIDNEDIDKIINHSWWATSKNYVYCKTKCKNIAIHRFLMNPPQNMQIDHINHNPLDNRKTNLRICTQIQNLKNRVFKNDKRIQIEKYESKKNKGITWYLSIFYNRQRHYIGKYKSYDEAFKFGSECLKNIEF